MAIEAVEEVFGKTNLFETKKNKYYQSADRNTLLEILNLFS